MTATEISAIFLLAADLLDERDYADPVDAILAAQGHDKPAANAPLARKALHLIRKQDNAAAVVHANLGGGTLLTAEQLADLCDTDWAGVDFDMSACPEGPGRHEWAWWLRWSALDVRWAARRDATNQPPASPSVAKADGGAGQTREDGARQPKVRGLLCGSVPSSQAVSS